MNVAKSNHSVLALTESLQLNMESIRKFAERIDNNFAQKFNYLKHFHEDGNLTDIHRVEDLKKPMDRMKYARLLEEFKVERYENQWSQVIDKHLDYAHI